MSERTIEIPYSLYLQIDRILEASQEIAEQYARLVEACQAYHDEERRPRP